MAFESKQSVSQSVSQQGGYRAARAAKNINVNNDENRRMLIVMIGSP